MEDKKRIVLDIIRELTFDDITTNSDFNMLDFDHIDLVEIVMEIEKRFNIASIDEDKIGLNFATVGDFIDGLVKDLEK